MLSSLQAEEVPCPLCASPRNRPLYTNRSATPRFEGFAVVACVACGFRFTSPRPTRDSMSRFYPAGYGPYRNFQHTPVLFNPGRSTLARLKNGLKYMVLTRRYGCPIQPTPELMVLPWPAVLEGMAFAVYRHRNPRVPFRTGAGRALDIGCGNGAHLLLLKQLGWDVSGFDLHDYTDPSVRAAGIEVFTGRLEGLPSSCSGYDSISMWHVLEHLHDPVAALRSVARLLAPAGTLQVEVPNSGSAAARVLGTRWHQWDLPRHLSHFTQESLTRVFNLAGLRIRQLAGLRKTALPQALRAWAATPESPRRLKRILRMRGFERLARVAGYSLSMLGPGENILVVAGK